MPRRTETIDIPDTDLWTTLFERKYRPFPDSQVLYHDAVTSREYSYALLREVTINFGSALQQEGWRKGDVLAVFSPNCIDTPAVTWGAIWAGGVVSPANPAYTARELVHHLRDSGAKILVTQKPLLKVALEAAAQSGISKHNVILVGDEKVQGLRHISDVLETGKRCKGEKASIVAANDLAFLVYSSGTTGLPKGVMLTHTNVVSDLLMINSSEGTLLRWDKDKILSVLPYYHIYGLQCLVHFPCYAGLTTIVMSAFSLPNFLSLIQKHKITYIYVAPPVVLHLAKSSVVDAYDLSSLRMITSGAAPLSKELIYAVKNRLNTEVKQGYGLSETSAVTHMQKVWNHALGSNGPALPNQICKFVSPDGEAVDIGKEGELWISGPNVFLGYHNNIEATKACKTEDGFFKTGDIGYEDEDGNMYITDRLKELIKYKGFQVAPAELEGILAGNEMIDDVAVIGIQDEERATEVPMACVVLKQGAEWNDKNKESIIKWLDDKVAGHKRLRGGVQWIEEVPKSASGKIFRRVLKEKMGKTLGIKPKL